MVEQYKLDPDECLNIIEGFFQNTFKKFSLVKKGTYTGYWWLEYKFEDQSIRIYFDGDIGGHFSIQLFINNDEFFLWQFDKSVNKKTLSSRNNLIYQLEVLKNFLK